MQVGEAEVVDPETTMIAEEGIAQLQKRETPRGSVSAAARRQIWTEESLTRLCSEAGKHAVSDSESFSTLSSTSVRIRLRRRQLGSEELNGHVLPAVGVDTTCDDEGVSPHLVIESETDGLPSFSAKEKRRHLIEIGTRDSVRHEGS